MSAPLNSQQFLPGLEHLSGVERAPTPPRVATSGQWSGQIPGQLVMGVHSAEHGNPRSLNPTGPATPFEVDRHGFVHEETRVRVGSDHHRVKPAADAVAGNKSARDLYRSFGGANDKSDAIREHWSEQPLHQISADTPVHTMQDYATTEHKEVISAGKDPGRWRIDAMRGTLREGGSLGPAWIVKQSGRLFAMDGHHRIVASREEGKPNYPAHVWDRDKE